MIPSSFQILDVKPGSVLVVKSGTMTETEQMRLALDLLDHLRKAKIKDVAVIFARPDLSIENLDAAEMKRCGWVRIS